ncbi:hypothetical protein Pelo_7471 [Pelomyxa schiedti]|nr:hypothetical protein Pelo_7471 [Pelomyxa schiedti]
MEEGAILLLSCRLDGKHDVEILVSTSLTAALETTPEPVGFGGCYLPDVRDLFSNDLFTVNGVPLTTASFPLEEELILFMHLPIEINFTISSFLKFRDLLSCKQHTTDWMMLYQQRCTVYEMNSETRDSLLPSQVVKHSLCQEATQNIRSITASSISKLWHSLMVLCTPTDQVLPQSELEKFIPEWWLNSLKSANIFDIKTNAIEGSQISLAMYGSGEQNQTVEHTELLFYLSCDQYYDLVEWFLSVTHTETGSQLLAVNSLSLRRLQPSKVSIYLDHTLPNLLTTTTSLSLRPFTRKDVLGRTLFWGVFSQLPQGLAVSSAILMLPQPDRDNINKNKKQFENLKPGAEVRCNGRDTVVRSDFEQQHTRLDIFRTAASGVASGGKCTRNNNQSTVISTPTSNRGNLSHFPNGLGENYVKREREVLGGQH